MKTLIVALFLLIGVDTLAQQNDYEYSRTIENELNKSLNYSNSKSFIATYWNSAKNVIQNDDKETGIVLIKAKVDFSCNMGMGLKNVYTYEYIATYRMKDSKCRLDINNIRCIKAKQVGFGVPQDIPLIQPYKGDTPQKLKKMGKGMSKKKADELMLDIDNHFSEILESYEKYMNSQSDMDF